MATGDAADTNPINANWMLSTPEGYATPEQIKELRQYSTHVGNYGEQGPMFKQVYSPWQGVSNMVNALMGGLGARQAATAEQRNATDTSGRTVRSITPSYPSGGVNTAPFGAKSPYGWPSVAPRADVDPNLTPGPNIDTG